MQATVSFHCLKWASVKPEFKQREQGSNIDVNYEAPLLADLNFFFMKKKVHLAIKKAKNIFYHALRVSSKKNKKPIVNLCQSLVCCINRI